MSKVAFIEASTYDREYLLTKLKQLLEPLGGIGNFVQRGDRVLIKPNLLSAHPPEKAIDTHPEFVSAVVLLLREVGAEVVVGDSPGGAVPRVEEVWEKSGLLAVAKELSFPLLNFNALPAKEIEIGGWRFRISEEYLKADRVINLPKLKTHTLTTFTLAVKNLYGVIPGFPKVHFHLSAPTPRDFSALLVDLYRVRPPDLNILDGILGMQGKGPSLGEPVKLNIISASDSAFALDSAVVEYLGFPQRIVPIFTEAKRRGMDWEWETVWVGEKVSPPPFKLPPRNVLYYAPRTLSKLVRPLVWMKPRVIREKCKGCGVCVENCPPRAITMMWGYPRFDYKKCIECFCCVETCPQRAIKPYRSLVLRLFTRG